MEPRINYSQVARGAMKAMRALEAYVSQSGLEPALLDLVKLRASQINGCAYCIDMHTKDARGAAKLNSASTRSAPGRKPPSTQNGSEPRWPGLRL